MRLTNVAQMRLPDGRVFSQSVSVGAPGREVPISFDQRRHVGAGQRPGSWMAVAFDAPVEATLEQIGAAWMQVVARHGTLRTVFTGPPDQPRLHEVEVAAGAWQEHPSHGRESRQVLRSILDEHCGPFSAPSHRLCVVRADGPGPDVFVLGADHSHVDAWSLLILMRDLTAQLRGTSDELPAAPPAFAEHTAALEARDPAPPEVASRWSQIIARGGGAMPRFPLDLGDVSTPRPEVVEVRDVLDARQVGQFDRRARERGVRMISLATSVLAGTLAEAGSGPLRAVLPVHSRYEQRWHDSVGWFITNSVLEVREVDPRACAEAVTEAVALGSHALGPILEPYGGWPQQPGMLAISWLDNRRLPVAVDVSLRPQHVSAVIETDNVMLWLVVNDDGLHLRCRYPDTPQARRTVRRWLDATSAGLLGAVMRG